MCTWYRRMSQEQQVVVCLTLVLVGVLLLPATPGRCQFVCCSSARSARFKAIVVSKSSRSTARVVVAYVPGWEMFRCVYIWEVRHCDAAFGA
jgi:hypothetical protein